MELIEPTFNHSFFYLPDNKHDFFFLKSQFFHKAHQTTIYSQIYENFVDRPMFDKESFKKIYIRRLQQPDILL